MPKLGMEPIRREQIRRAATKVIAKHGFDNATLKDVANEAKVSTGTINHYYPNKLAVLVDALVYVSDWFQKRTREAVAGEATGLAKLEAFLRVNTHQTSAEAQRGFAVWTWALSVSIRSKALRNVIEERRRIWQLFIADILRELDVTHRMSDEEIRELAAEYDAYVNGLCIHRVTGEGRLKPEAIQRSLLAMAMARLGANERSEATKPFPRPHAVTGQALTRQSGVVADL